MALEHLPLAQSVESYLTSRPRAARWLEWLAGRRYRLAAFPDHPLPVVVIAHRGHHTRRAEQVARAIEHDWAETPPHCRDAYRGNPDPCAGVDRSPVAAQECVRMPGPSARDGERSPLRREPRCLQ